MLGKCSTRCHLEMWSLGCLPKSEQYILVDMFAKCGCLGDAWKMFNKMPPRNVVTRMSTQKWTIYIIRWIYILGYQLFD